MTTLNSFPLSPSKSNKIPNSLAFKRSSKEQSSTEQIIRRNTMATAELERLKVKSIDSDEEIN